MKETVFEKKGGKRRRKKKGGRKRSASEREGINKSEAQQDNRVALTNILHLLLLHRTEGGGFREPVEQMPNISLDDGPRLAVPYWLVARGPQACIGRAARAGHLHLVGGATAYKRPCSTPLPVRDRLAAEQLLDSRHRGFLQTYTIRVHPSVVCSFPLLFSFSFLYCATTSVPVEQSVQFSPDERTVRIDFFSFLSRKDRVFT